MINKNIIIIVIALVLGFVIGYLKSNNEPKRVVMDNKLQMKNDSLLEVVNIYISKTSQYYERSIILRDSINIQKLQLDKLYTNYERISNKQGNNAMRHATVVQLDSFWANYKAD